MFFDPALCSFRYRSPPRANRTVLCECPQVVGQITSVKPVQDIMYDLVTEYADAAERLTSLEP